MKKSFLYQLRLNSTVTTLCLLPICHPYPAAGVILLGNSDPTANTTPPAGSLADSGWQFQGYWGNFLGTPIAPQYFIAAQHVGGTVGQTFSYQDLTYTTTAYWDDANSDLRIWKVDGVFPAYAPLYSGNDEMGKHLVVFGRGTQRGDEFQHPKVTTNTITTSYNLRTLGITSREAKKLYPDAVIKGSTLIVSSTEVVTNSELRGWQFGAADAVMRWGVNDVTSTSGCLAAGFHFDGTPDESYLSSGDSSGGVFIQENGIWKLAGINYAIEGPFSNTSDDPGCYAAIFDKSGLYSGGVQIPESGMVRPANFYASRISANLPWIQSVIGQ